MNDRAYIQGFIIKKWMNKIAQPFLYKNIHICVFQYYRKTNGQKNIYQMHIGMEILNPKFQPSSKAVVKF